jgi:gliding motility-associated-like protein
MDSASFNYTFPPGSAPPLHLQFLPKYITLTVTDDGGCKARDSVAVYLRKPAANVGFALMDSGSCSPWAWMDLDEYEFVGGVPPIYGDLYWKFDTDSVYNSKSLFDPHGTQIFSKGNPGNVNAYVKITGDSMGYCPVISRDTTFEFVVNNIKAGFTISDTLFECAPATVSFTDSTTVLIGDSIPIEEWNWTLYNESGAVVRTSVLKNPVFQLDDPGYYTLEMMVTDENGCEGLVVSDSVLLIDSSRVQIILPNDTICSGEALEYKGVVGDGYSYTWDFGDGAVYDEEVLTYTFHQPGMKVVRLIVLDCDDTPYLDTIFVKPSPVLGLNDTTICAGDTARLNAPVLQGYSYLWEPSGSTVPGYSTTMPGTLFLTVEDTVLGCSSKDTIEVSNYDLPVVNIVSPDVICKGQVVQLHQSSSTGVVSYQWFDGSTMFSTNESPSLMIDSTRLITLLVTDTRGCENTTTGTIKAMEEPVVNLQDIVLCSGDSTIVSAEPVNQKYPEYHYTWWIDGENLPDTTGTIFVNNEGEYTLHLDVGACELSDTFYLRVNPKPDITQNSEGVVFCEEMTDVELDAGEATGYWWYHSHEKTRRVYVHSQDTFVVQLTNKYNCSINDTIVTYNRCAPKILTPNAFIPGKTGDEKFYVHAYNVENFNMIIFNRWGEIIFETEDPENAWDGTYQGEPMPAGVYPWLVKYTGDNPDHEHLQQKTGMVTLIR